MNRDEKIELSVDVPKNGQALFNAIVNNYEEIMREVNATKLIVTFNNETKIYEANNK